MTVEQAEQTAQETTEPLTPEQAQTEITRLQSDPDFLKVYLSPTNSDPGIHKEATSRMTGLYALANPLPGPLSATPRLDEKRAEVEQMQRSAAISEGKSLTDEQQSQEQQPLSEDEQYEAELDESKQIMQSRCGGDWQEEMEGVRDSIREVGGERDEALFDHLQSNYGNDPEVMSHLIQLQRENEQYPIVAALAELVDQNMTPNGALLQIERHLADPEFVESYTNGGAPGHKANQAVMRALFLAADPPAFIASGAQV